MIRARTVFRIFMPVVVIATALGPFFTQDEPAVGPARSDRASQGCLSCHGGIEEMHPWHHLTCVDCHGGNGDAAQQKAAHVSPRRKLPGDERILPRDQDLAYLRFVNPTNLRVAGSVCGVCHGDAVSNLERSLHGTTAGHLSDGLYENGYLANRTKRYGIFPVTAAENAETPAHGFPSLTALPRFDPYAERDRIATHFIDAVRKSCLQCHLWSEGRAVRGRLGQDGDYRSDGCAACHVTYADSGLTQTDDPTIGKLEPGHPIRHVLTSKIPTETCTRCHYGDASIGLHFRGLAQLVPGMPAGPEVPNTTDSRLNGAFYLRDPEQRPADIHHAAGLACIDCHTVSDVMGDGNIYGEMEHAVEIECTTCHGTLERLSDGTTSRGRALPQLVRRGERVFMRSKLSGRVHIVKQTQHVVDPAHPHYNPRAAAAMTNDHDGLECYGCHNAWNVNFFGFHFDRNESFTQLDMLSGERTAGRVTTLEKVFATFDSLTLGRNSEGMIAPYLVGFSTFTTVRDAEGKTIIDQRMPETAAGLSGMTMVAHQMHTVRPAARSCVECHRSSAAWGLGTDSFALTRQLVLSTAPTGLEIVGIDRQNLAQSRLLARASMPAPSDIALTVDPLQAFAREAWVAVPGHGLTGLDLERPAFPEKLAELALPEIRAVERSGDHLLVAAGARGLVIVDVSDPHQPTQVGLAKTEDARDVAWLSYYAFVADGAAGLAIVDVADPVQPRLISRIDLNGAKNRRPNAAQRVVAFFQNGRPKASSRQRSPARLLVAVGDGELGVTILDATDPARPRQLFRNPGSLSSLATLDVVDLAITSKFDLGSPGGEIRSEEHPYLYVLANARRRQGSAPEPRWFSIRITDPTAPKLVGELTLPGGGIASGFGLLRLYNPPFLTFHALVTRRNRAAVFLDLTKSTAPKIAEEIPTLRGTGRLAVESMRFDQQIDATGRRLKDVSHEGAGYLSREEIVRLLRVKLPKDGSVDR